MANQFPTYQPAAQTEQVDNQGLALFPTSYAYIAAGTAADTVVKASAGRLFKVIAVGATGTNPATVWDNATTHTGNIVAQLPASPTLGSVWDVTSVACTNGITVQGSATNPGLLVLFA